MKPLNIPVKAVGFDQEEDTLAYLSMPQGMTVYTVPRLPEPDTVEQGAKAVLEAMLEALSICRVDDATPRQIDLGHLSAKDRVLVGQILGEGEVSIRIDGSLPLHIQESVLTGLWQVCGFDLSGSRILDEVEVAGVPARVIVRAQEYTTGIDFPEIPPQGVMNAPSVLAELRGKAENYTAGDAAHVVNLTLLPMSVEDIVYLKAVLGTGCVTVLSRGYGNCRITSTRLANLWWVQYYNSQDMLILNTLEVVDLPEVVRAAQQDIDDSRERLSEILQWIAC